jgi:hypothetical protein
MPYLVRFAKGRFFFLAISFFATAGYEVKLCCDNFHTTLTAVPSGKGVLMTAFPRRKLGLS